MSFPAGYSGAPRSILPSRPGIAAMLKATMLEWRRRQRGRDELARLSDRGRRDIGLSNCDVDAETGKPFWIP